MGYFRDNQCELLRWVIRLVRAQFEKKNFDSRAVSFSTQRYRKHRNLNIRNICFLKCSSAEETRNLKQFRAFINYRIRNESIVLPFAL